MVGLVLSRDSGGCGSRARSLREGARSASPCFATVHEPHRPCVRVPDQHGAIYAPAWTEGPGVDDGSRPRRVSVSRAPRGPACTSRATVRPRLHGDRAAGCPSEERTPWVDPSAPQQKRTPSTHPSANGNRVLGQDADDDLQGREHARRHIRAAVIAGAGVFERSDGARGSLPFVDREFFVSPWAWPLSCIHSGPCEDKMITSTPSKGTIGRRRKSRGADAWPSVGPCGAPELPGPPHPAPEHPGPPVPPRREPSDALPHDPRLKLDARQ